jgi:hypothetical protein
MNVRIRLAGLVLLVLGGGAPAQDQPRRWHPVPAGMVLTRNFMMPKSPKKEGYQLLPGKYRLGSKAYAKAPPDWWLKLIGEAKVGDKWHPKDFPLVFAGEFTSTGGSRVLLVVQASQAFTGDGYWSPGPEVYLIARIFSIEGAGLKLTKEEAYSLGGMQYGSLFAGRADGRRIVFHTEGGPDFDSRTVTWTRDLVLSVSDDNSLSMDTSRMTFGNRK